jgi:hypothetical protein
VFYLGAIKVGKSNKSKFDVNSSKKASNNSKVKNARNEAKNLKKIIAVAIDSLKEEDLLEEEEIFEINFTHHKKN